MERMGLPRVSSLYDVSRGRSPKPGHCGRDAVMRVRRRGSRTERLVAGSCAWPPTAREKTRGAARTAGSFHENS